MLQKLRGGGRILQTQPSASLQRHCHRSSLRAAESRAVPHSVASYQLLVLGVEKVWQSVVIQDVVYQGDAATDDVLTQNKDRELMVIQVQSMLDEVHRAMLVPLDQGINIPSKKAR
ncbi:hypothetical protein MY11210_006190 [Beauveria gryllotalpidicola]